jgi:hypothetical protein
VADESINIVVKARDAASGPLGRIQRALGGIGRTAASSLKTVGRFAAIGLAGLAAAVGGLAIAAVKGAAQNERYAAQLEVLLGSAKAAKDRLKELTEFAKKTPFELPDVIEASRTLQVFTKGALATGKGLEMVGDIAAGTGQPFQDVAMWVGRLYDAMKSGRPFGEATMRLQEMGAMSGKSREEIEDLAKKVKSGAITMEEAWERVGGEFSMFSGLMEKQSHTLEGMWSNLQDALGQGLVKIGEKLMPLAKEIIPRLSDGIAAMAGFIADDLVPAIAAWFKENEPLITQVREFVTGAVIGLRDSIQNVIGRIQGLVTSITSNEPVMDTLRGIARRISDAFGAVADFIGAAIIKAKEMATWISDNKTLQQGFRDLVQQIGEKFEFVRKKMVEVTDTLRKWVAEIEKNRETMRFLRDVVNQVGIFFDDLAKGIDESGRQIEGFIGWVESADNPINILKNRIQTIADAFNNLANNIRYAIAQLRILIGLEEGRGGRVIPKGGGGTIGGRQHGGPVMAGGVYRVGEAGPETLVMGRSGGYVIPHGGGSSSRPVELIVQVDGQNLLRIIDKRLALAYATAPVTTRTT